MKTCGFRPIGACLRRTPFWRTKSAAQTLNYRTPLPSKAVEAGAECGGSVHYVGLQNKVEGRQAPAQPK